MTEYASGIIKYMFHELCIGFENQKDQSVDMTRTFVVLKGSLQISTAILRPPPVRNLQSRQLMSADHDVSGLACYLTTPIILIVCFSSF